MNFPARTALAGVGLVLCMAAAPAAALTVYHGGDYVGSFVGCESEGWSGVNMVTARLVPAGLPGNDTETQTLVVQLGDGTHSYRMSPDLDLGGWLDVEFWQVWEHAPYQVTDPQVRLRAIL